MIRRKEYDLFMQVKRSLKDKYGESLPNRLTFMVSDFDIALLKSYKQYLEYNLKQMNRILELFVFEEE